MSRVHICFGKTDEHLAELERLAKSSSDSDGWWTINSKANPGDRAVFYMILPRSQFVATGTVAEKPYVKRTGDYAGMYRASMVGIKMLPRPIHLHEVRDKFPNWAYLRAPRRSAAVPDDLASRYLKFLESETETRVPFTDESDIEGIRIEVAYFAKTRSKRLRDLAMAKSRGICCVCGTDFSKVLNGRGVRVLQVHHRNQLSTQKGQATTRIGDLAVVCANCHLLLHLDSQDAISVEELREMLRQDS